MQKSVFFLLALLSAAPLPSSAMCTEEETATMKSCVRGAFQEIKEKATEDATQDKQARVVQYSYNVFP